VKAAKTAGKRCTLIGDTVILEGKRYPWDKMETLPKEIKPQNVSSKWDNEGFAFYGKLNPLSNFHVAKFSIDDVTYNCVEQYYQYQKAVMFKDVKAAKQILDASEPSRQKQIAKSIVDFCEETWEPNAKEIMFNGILAKFSQNEPLLRYLEQTGSRHLYEASPRDLYWGVGLPLSSPDILIKGKHKGLNYLGDILMTVRSQLTSVNMDSNQ
jgi:hypothetical protein